MLKFPQIIILYLLPFFVPKCCLDEISTKVITAKAFMYWPNATVPFYINPDHFDHEQAMIIMTSLSMFAFKTCLKFAPVMTSPDENQHVLAFINPEGLKRCKIHSEGHSNYHPHLIWLGYECLKSPHIDMIIMRALGFPFEHNRMSRDVYIDVILTNVEPSAVDLFTKDSVLPPALRSLPYDVNSVMHFGEREYSKNGHRTIIFKNHNTRQQRNGLTATDLRKIELVYGPECRARDRQEKLELCQSYPGVARRKREVKPYAQRSLRVNPNITPPPELLAQENANQYEQGLAEDIQESEEDYVYLEESLKGLGIANDTEKILEKIYKLPMLALKNAREKFCNTPTNGSVNFGSETERRKRRNSSEIIGVLEVITDYVQSMVDDAMNNITAFCQNPKPLHDYQRNCGWSLSRMRCIDKRDGPVDGDRKTTVISSKTSIDDRKVVTASAVKIRRKRETSDNPAPPIKEKKSRDKKILKQKAKISQKEKHKDNTTVTIKAVATQEKAPRRYFKETRYKGKKPDDGPEGDSNMSLDKSNAEDQNEKKEEEVYIDDQEGQQKEKEDDLHNDISLETHKNKYKEELVKEVLNEGIDDIFDKSNKEKDETAEDNLENNAKLSEEEKNEAEKNAEEVTEKTDPVEEEEVKEEQIDNNETSAETEAVETTTEKQKLRKKKASLDLQLDVQASNEVVHKPKEEKSHSRKGRKPRIPKTVKLNKLNMDFYNERSWPDGVVIYVIKKLPGYDLEDLRNRLAAVNSILTTKTCVKLREVPMQEAEGFDDYIILDNSPDYVTGRVGGRQVFGCVELFQGGQHRQHTAMMVMAMLGFYFEVSRHDRDEHIRVHNRHIRPDKLHHFEKIRDEATLDIPYDYKSATHPAWQFWRKVGKTGISTVATYKSLDPDGSVMRSLGQNPELLSEYDLVKINSVYGVECFKNDEINKKKQIVEID